MPKITNKPKCPIVIGADRPLADAAIQYICAAIKRENNPNINTQHLDLILSEVLSNIIFHADKHQQQIAIMIAWRINADAILVQIVDDGAEFRDPPSHRVPMLKQDKASLPEGGWGLNIVKGLTQKFQIRRNSGLNYTKFRIDIKYR